MYIFRFYIHIYIPKGSPHGGAEGPGDAHSAPEASLRCMLNVAYMVDTICVACCFVSGCQSQSTMMHKYSPQYIRFVI